MKIITILAALLFQGCASIISGNTETISINSTPDKSEYIIKEKTGRVVQTGVTPDVVTLNTGKGYFEGSNYYVEVSKDGFTSKSYPLNSKINMWYFGNAIFPVAGLIVGMGIVDPSTGAMWKLPDQVDVTLQKSSDK